MPRAIEELAPLCGLSLDLSLVEVEVGWILLFIPLLLMLSRFIGIDMAASYHSALLKESLKDGRYEVLRELGWEKLLNGLGCKRPNVSLPTGHTEWHLKI